MAIVGLGLVAISVLGQEPGYGVLSLYVIYCLTLSHSMFFLRVTVMLAVIGCHVAAIRIWNSVRCALWHVHVHVHVPVVVAVGDVFPRLVVRFWAQPTRHLQ